jgi:desulfoferrodoxin (superoxide reductase-like protein)
MFIMLTLFMSSIAMVSANVPTVKNIEAATSGDGRVLTITISHSNPSSTHYVSKLEIKVGDNTETVNLDPQSTETFTVEVNVPASGSVEVRAFCTLHGWSSWAALGDGSQSSTGGSGGGISGFPFVSLVIGVILSMFLLRRRM